MPQACPATPSFSGLGPAVTPLSLSFLICLVGTGEGVVCEVPSSRALDWQLQLTLNPPLAACSLILGGRHQSWVSTVAPDSFSLVLQSFLTEEADERSSLKQGEPSLSLRAGFWCSLPRWGGGLQLSSPRGFSVVLPSWEPHTGYCTVSQRTACRHPCFSSCRPASGSSSHFISPWLILHHQLSTVVLLDATCPGLGLHPSLGVVVLPAPGETQDLCVGLGPGTVDG